MKFETTAPFEAEYRRLSQPERKLFRVAVHIVNATYNAQRGKTGDLGIPRWPAKLRIKEVKDAKGIFEMTWSFSGPDGRATFEYVTVDGEPAIRWRHIGGHSIFKDP